MCAQKRSYDEAFQPKEVESVRLDDYFVDNTVYKTSFCNLKDYFTVRTMSNKVFDYHEDCIKKTSTSATCYNMEKKVTRTDLIKLFSMLSPRDVWTAVYYKYETDEKWEEKLVAEIQGMQKDDAVKYVKQRFRLFGKIERKLTGQKTSPSSDNNYYLVRDFDFYFEELKNGSDTTVSMKNSIRTLDVNTLQSLIFNTVKYTLK